MGNSVGFVALTQMIQTLPSYGTTAPDSAYCTPTELEWSQRLTCQLGRAVKTAGLSELHQNLLLTLLYLHFWASLYPPHPYFAPLGEPHDICMHSRILVLRVNNVTPSNHSSLRNSAWPLDITTCV